jgi:branched-chain amino acid aminotransferase
VIAPIGTVKDGSTSFDMRNALANDSVAQTLRRNLTELQRGAAPDPYGWVQRVF